MTDATARTLVEQYWNHARHQEEQRFKFTQLYLVAVGGIVAFAASASPPAGLTILLSLLVAVMSVFAWVATHMWSTTFVIFSRLAEKTAVCALDVPREYSRFLRERTPAEEKDVPVLGKPFRLSAYRMFSLLDAIILSAALAVGTGELSVLETHPDLAPLLSTIAFAVTFVLSVKLVVEIDKRVLDPVKTTFANEVEQCLANRSRTPETMDVQPVAGDFS